MESINLASTGFVLLCTALVFLMTPGLAIFYGGLSNEKNILNIMFQNFICLGIVSVLWVIIGFSLAFGTDVSGVIGSFASFPFLKGVTAVPNPLFSDDVPFVLIFGYQMMFAVITPALMTGAFLGRLRMVAYLKLISIWLLLVYVPVAHWVWGGGFLKQMGVVDFAGGLTVHTTAGISALVIAIYLGKRRVIDDTPVNLPLTAIGAGLLWFGWFGFNAGGAYAPNELAAHAFINTTLAASSGMLVWLSWQRLSEKKITFSGMLVGSVAGLATITPAAGYVEAIDAMLIGIIGATACYWAKHIQSFFKIDDALEVWRAHGVGGITGTILVGVFANISVDDVSSSMNLLTKQTMAVLIVAVYSALMTYIILRVLNRKKHIRVSFQNESFGQDMTELHEKAFDLNVKP